MSAAKVLMADVAKAAGVARVTVSRVLSDPDSVAPATRAAVQAAVARLGHIPNLNAGTLASSRLSSSKVATLASLIKSMAYERHFQSCSAWIFTVGPVLRGLSPDDRRRS